MMVMRPVRLQANIDPSFYRMLGAHGESALVESFMIKCPSVSQRMAAGKALHGRPSRITKRSRKQNAPAGSRSR
jgi:hypothetical protein